MRNGFHEDGFASAVDVVEAMAAAAPRTSRWPRMTTVVDHIAGETFHGRKGAVENAFRYSVDYVLLDAETGLAGPRLFSRNRAQPRLAARQRPWRRAEARARGAAWAREVLAAHGLDQAADGQILLLAQPRVLGHVFNPVSFWLCHDRDGRAARRHRRGDQHLSATGIPTCATATISRRSRRDDTLQARKIFHVSPFQPVEGGYAFRFDIRADRIGIWIDYTAPATAG